MATATDHLNDLIKIKGADPSRIDKAVKGLAKKAKKGEVDLEPILREIAQEDKNIEKSTAELAAAERAAESAAEKYHAGFKVPAVSDAQKTEWKRIGDEHFKAEAHLKTTTASHEKLLGEQRFEHIKESHTTPLMDIHQKQFAKRLKTMDHDVLGDLIKGYEKEPHTNLTGIKLNKLQEHHAKLVANFEKAEASAAAARLAGPGMFRSAYNAAREGFVVAGGGAGKVLGVANKGMKGAGKGALVAGGLVALGSFLAFSPRGHKFNPDEQPIAPLPPLLTPQDLMMQQQFQSQMATPGPAEGYAQNQWQNYVRPGQSQQPAMDAAQPRMSAVSPEMVQNLGGLTPQKA